MFAAMLTDAFVFNMMLKRMMIFWAAFLLLWMVQAL
jgi:hypothetical protein